MIRKLLFLVWLLCPLSVYSGQSAILVIGDSLSAGYGIPPEATWASLLNRRLAESGKAYRVVNASITGETTHGGVTRLPQLLQRESPAIVIIALGANDGLRGLSLKAMKVNLLRMVEMAQASGARVLLAGIRIPENYGPEYAQAFFDVYPDVALQAGVPLLPFLLEHVALDPSLMQDDGLHPAENAQPVILDNLWPLLQPML